MKRSYLSLLRRIYKIFIVRNFKMDEEIRDKLLRKVNKLEEKKRIIYILIEIREKVIREVREAMKGESKIYKKVII